MYDIPSKFHSFRYSFFINLNFFIDPEREEEKKLERAQRGHEPDWDVILNVTATPPLLIVDAYNVIHQWPRLKKWMRKGETYRARNLLVQDLETLSSVKG
jgi:hypothetical protein